MQLFKLSRQAWVWVIPALSGCAEVQVFDVYPRIVCPKDEVRVIWSASGSVEITPKVTVPGGKEPGSAGTGTAPVSSEPKTRFQLTARRLFGNATAEWDVEVIPKAKDYAEKATCDETRHELEAKFVLGEALSPRIEVQSVRNVLERELLVLKEGAEVHLEQGATSEALKGRLALGTWTLRSPLGPQESCESALHSVRQFLTVSVQFQCGE